MIAERVESWTQQWLRQGRQEGESVLLRRQLHLRFGPLPAWVGERLGQASEAELEHWADNILDARSLDEVFQD